MVEKDAVRTPKSNCDKDEYKGEDLDNKRERTVIPSDDLWKEYYIHGRLRHLAVARVIKVQHFHDCCCTLVPIVSNIVAALPRRDSCIFWEETSRVLSFSIIMLLTFLVLDVQRLCLHWIEKIRTKHPLLMDITTLARRSEDQFAAYEAMCARTASHAGSQKNPSSRPVDLLPAHRPCYC